LSQNLGHSQKTILLQYEPNEVRLQAGQPIGVALNKPRPKAGVKLYVFASRATQNDTKIDGDSDEFARAIEKRATIMVALCTSYT